jgi:hypothetical protein
MPTGSLSSSSLSFLRAAFAPVDFPQLAVEGVPDNFTGPSVVKQHSLVTTITVAAGKSRNFLCLPTPGVAFWSTPEDGLVTDNWQGTYYGDYESCFPKVRGTRNGVFSKFRYIGACIEFRPTSSTVSNAGSISCARVPIAVSDKAIDNADIGSNIGAPYVQARWIDLSPASESGYTQGACYVSHVNDGCYSVAINDGCWDFEPIWPGDQAIPPSEFRNSSGALSPVVAGNGRLLDNTEGSNRIVGFGHLSAIAVKVTAVSSVSFTVITRAIVEYLPEPFTIVYNMARPSPPVDQMALAMYSQICSTLPPGVTYSENETFWRKVWAFLRRALNLASTVGPAFGPIGAGVGTVAGSIGALGDMLAKL